MIFFLKKLCSIILILVATSLLVTGGDKTAYAHNRCTIPSTQITPFPCKESTDIKSWWLNQKFTDTQENFLKENFYKQKIIDELWTNNVEPALKNMTAQITASNIQSTGSIGGMMDGMAANDAILASQTLQADAYRDYTPSEGLCRFGTNVRSLAATQEHELTTWLSLAQITESRIMGKSGGQSGPGEGTDKVSRYNQFQRVYCDPGDNNGFMKNLCYATTTAPSSTPKRFNKDIDYVRTIDRALTLDVDFTDGKITNDEEDVLALSSNLYAYNLFDTLPPAIFKNDAGHGNKNLYLDIRQIATLHGLAQNSFNEIIAARASGNSTTTSQSVAPYMTNVMKELGMTDNDTKTYLTSNTGRLSYNAQMEILTKKIYQNPNFYTNLIDKPANVKRQIAAMKAIDVTQNRGIFESLERQELLLSALLELEIRDEQQRLVDNSTGGK